MKNILCALALALGLSGSGPLFAQVRNLPVQASPTLWHIQGEQGEVYLLGSIHVLPPNLRWRTPAIQRALARADVYVFEVPEDQGAMIELSAVIKTKGYLPEGESLRDRLHSASLADYDAAVEASGLSPSVVERERPWLAGLQLMFAQISKLKYAADSGVDSVLMAKAAKDGKQMRYLETVAEQIALLVPDDKRLEVQEFESGLKDLRDIAGELDPMVAAWGTGDQARLDILINGDLEEFPEARKMLLDDRNRRWVLKIQAMLQEKHVFFVTVGAGHLTGALGVPALLRKEGLNVVAQ